mmetsp:Transcript_36093/g.56499  ORF Transcript_36093/g.56499 Transcript_36093/m.56499 type:complete len:212 (+) Transcript_36093:7268-7903(+)
MVALFVLTLVCTALVKEKSRTLTTISLLSLFLCTMTPSVAVVLRPSRRTSPISLLCMLSKVQLVTVLLLLFVNLALKRTVITRLITFLILPTCVLVFLVMAPPVIPPPSAKPQETLAIADLVLALTAVKSSSKTILASVMVHRTLVMVVRQMAPMVRLCVPLVESTLSATCSSIAILMPFVLMISSNVPIIVLRTTIILTPTPPSLLLLTG